MIEDIHYKMVNSGLQFDNCLGKINWFIYSLNAL